MRCFHRLFIYLMVVATLIAACQPLTSQSTKLLQPAGSVSSPTHSENIELIGHVGGSMLSVAINGNRAFVGFSTHFVVLDISDPTQPRWMAELPISANAIELRGPYAYIDGADGLFAVDISDPEHPIQVNRLEFSSVLTAISIADAQAYLLGDSKLYVVKLGTQGAMERIAELMLSVPGESIAALSGYAYIGSTQGLYVIDVRDPLQPVTRAFHNFASTAYGVTSADGVIYFINQGQLYTINGLRPTQIVSYQPIDVEGWIGEMIVTDGVVYLTDGGALLIWRIADAGLPEQIGRYPSEGLGITLAVADKRVYLVDCDEGLRIFDAANPDALVEIGHFQTLGATFSVQTSCTSAWVLAGFNGGVHWIDAADPAQCHTIDLHVLQNNVTAFACNGQQMYALAAGSLYVLDVTAPGQPVIIGKYASREFYNLFLAEKYAFVGNGQDAIWILNIENPTEPQLVAQYDAIGYISGMAVDGAMAYLPTPAGGFQLARMEASGQLVRVSTFAMDRQVVKIDVQNGYAYVVDANGVLWIVDVRHPAAPRMVAIYALPADGSDVMVAGQYAYVAAGEAGVRIIDISDPASPHEVGYYRTPNRALSLTYANGVIYVADTFGGLVMLRFAP
ncbi:MAG: hypothetical protein R2911_21490 [Caldilineaceae bacterium]